MGNIKIAIIGLGYVGLPLAIEFGKKYTTLGYDINDKRVEELNAGIDSTLEVDNVVLKEMISKEDNDRKLLFTSDPDKLRDCTVFIITVPTPVDQQHQPDLSALRNASKSVGKALKKGDTVIYESTVFPGATEEVCVPELEKASGLKFNSDFFIGYSPERINPGDKVHTLTTIRKITSGSTPEAAEKIDALYNTILKNGTYKAPSIKIAEAAKVIENCQRDLNISFVNELALIFDRMDIDTNEVIEAAGTKWNFLKFKPGLVGGHCIGVDPYYLTAKAESLGYYPQVILSGRRVNEEMGKFVASKVIKLMIKKGIAIKDSNVLVLGITFKENCPDIRNTKAVDVIHELKDYGCNVQVYDPWADPEEVSRKFGLELIPAIGEQPYDAIVLVVAHNDFLSFPFRVMKKEKTVIYDVKGVLPVELVDGRL